MGIWDAILGERGSEDRLRLKMGLMGLTHRPNTALMQQWSNDLSTMQGERKAAETTNRTAAFLRNMGTPQAMQAADALEAGMVDASTAYQMATAKPEQRAGIEVGNRIVDPVTGKIIYDGGGEAATPQSAIAKLAADLRAGLITQQEYDLEIARMTPRGTQLVVDPKTGAVTFTQGTTTGSLSGNPTVGQVYNPVEVQSVVDLIDDIKANPRLDRITGALMGGGGNNIDELNAIQRLYYGEEGLDAIDKLGQLGSQAWFAARDLLKGGGQITDYESQKAERAVARLSRAKGEEELVAALDDLRSAIVEGEAKLRAAGKLPSAPTAPQAGASSILTPEDLKYLETP